MRVEQINRMGRKKRKKVDIVKLKHKIWSSGKRQIDIAKELKTSPAFVSMVIHGKKTSKRVVDYIMSLEKVQ